MGAPVGKNGPLVLGDVAIVIYIHIPMVFLFVDIPFRESCSVGGVLCP